MAVDSASKFHEVPDSLWERIESGVTNLQTEL